MHRRNGVPSPQTKTDPRESQVSTEAYMITIDYRHTQPPGFESRLIRVALGLSGIKRAIEKRIFTNSFVKNPSKLPQSFVKNFDNQEIELNGRKVWTISPKYNKSDVTILYFHGGAYVFNISRLHWSFIWQLIKKTNATIVVPDYPLAPEATYSETYNFIGDLYSELTAGSTRKKIVFMGDSAGGGLAFGYAQQLKIENRNQPDQLILFSPWLDVTMTNPDIKPIEKEDKILSVEGLREAAREYAGSTDLKDYRLSPLYGSFTGLCSISVFAGTKDILYPDAQKFRQLMKDQSTSFNWFEYPGMFHDWVIITRLRESEDVIHKVTKLVNNSD